MAEINAFVFIIRSRIKLENCYKNCLFVLLVKNCICTCMTSGQYLFAYFTLQNHNNIYFIFIIYNNNNK